jgi:hypothetical protein
VADAVSSLLTADGLKAAVTIPNMPPPLPPDYTPLTSAPAAAAAGPLPRRPTAWGCLAIVCVLQSLWDICMLL